MPATTRRQTRSVRCSTRARLWCFSRSAIRRYIPHTGMYTSVLPPAGYAAELVPGVPSFCAAAAAMGRALCEDGEMLHIIPATHGRAEEGLALSGSKVLMKTGKSVLEVRELLRQRGELGSAALIERVGMDGQRLIENLDELEQPSGYFSIILVKEQSE